MAQSISCPSCGARLRLPDAPGARKLRCPRCRGAVVATPLPSAIDPGFVDEPCGNEIGDDAPIPLSQAVRKVRDAYNPFDDGSDEDDNPKSKRRGRKPKDEFNPFAEAPAAEPQVGDAGADSVFEFGVDGPPPPPPTGEFDFNSEPADDPTRRRRR
jgi:hypothetical protein